MLELQTKSNNDATVGKSTIVCLWMPKRVPFSQKGQFQSPAGTVQAWLVPRTNFPSPLKPVRQQQAEQGHMHQIERAHKPICAYDTPPQKN